jgi:hypothetical protein
LLRVALWNWIVGSVHGLCLAYGPLIRSML